MSNYLLQRRALKNGPSAPVAPKKKKPIPQKSAKRIEQEKSQPKKPRSPIAKKSAKQIKKERAEVTSEGITRLSKFYRQMLEAAPELCMESGEPLINDVYAGNPMSIVAHILPKRAASQGGVPSMAKDARNIMYFTDHIHNDRFDPDMGTKSEGNYIRSMKCYPVLLERVAAMWPEIPQDERKNVPHFLRPKDQQC